MRRFQSLMKGKAKLAVCALLLLLQPAVTPPPAGAMGSRPSAPHGRSIPVFDTRDPEALVVKALNEIRQDRLDAALDVIDYLLEIKPNFRLAQLIKGDLLLSRARPLTSFGGNEAAVADDFRQEALVRLKRYQEKPPVNQVPAYLLQMLPEQNYAIVVDASRSRLYLYQNVNGLPRYVTDYYITIGKNGVGKSKEGDKLSPMGVYFVTSSLSKDKLTDFYGPIAFPLSYPNEWDKRLGRDGHGIWLHGTPTDTYSRPPRASDGCVVLTNPDILSISKSIQTGLTPVVISDHVDWVDVPTLNKERDELYTQVENWRRAWESRDTDKYLRYYGSDFSADGQNLAAWGLQKRQVNASKTWIEIKLNRVSLFRYPGKEPMAVVTFDQDYRSNNLNNNMRKRQYWKQENGVWKIVYEGAA